MRLFEPYEGRDEFVYICAEGESLEDISERFMISVEKLVKLNGVSEVFCGDELLVVRGKGDAYRVKPGDTLESIAEKFNTTAELIKGNNGVDCVYPGLTLII